MTDLIQNIDNKIIYQIYDVYFDLFYTYKTPPIEGGYIFDNRLLINLNIERNK